MAIIVMKGFGEDHIENHIYNVRMKLNSSASWYFLPLKTVYIVISNSYRGTTSRLKIVTIGHKLYKDALDKLPRCMYPHDPNVNANHGNARVTKQIYS